MLHEFIATNRDELIGRCRAKVATRTVPPPTESEMNHGVPIFLDQLVEQLRLGLSANSAINLTATKHGRDLRRQGFTVSQVVHDYGDVCQAITEMAVERDAHIAADDFRMLNRCLDDAIASAVTEFSRDDEGADDGGGSEGVGLGKKLRHSIRTANVAFQVGRPGRLGSWAALGRSSTSTFQAQSASSISCSTRCIYAEVPIPLPRKDSSSSPANAAQFARAERNHRNSHGRIANGAQHWQYSDFMPHQTPCPNCGKVGLVRIEHVITGTTATRAFYCGGCDHQWSTTEQPLTAGPIDSALSKPRTRQYGPKRRE
jgi:hypothetical protein